MSKVKILIVLLFSLIVFGQQSSAACPRLNRWEFPYWNWQGNYISKPNVKRINIPSNRNETIFFCRANDITSAVTTITFNKTDLMNTQPGKAPGTDSIAFGNGAGSKIIGTGTADLTSTGGTIGPYQLKSLQSKIIPTQNMSSAWNQKILFHFYRRYSGSNCDTNGIILSYLRNNPSIFNADSQRVLSDSTHSYSIAKVTDVELTHQTNPTKKIKGDLEFIWSQNYMNGSCGGRVAGRYNHFGVAARLRIKTNAEGSTYDIDQAGTYELPNVGVFTIN